MMSDGEKFETLLPKKDVDLSSYESALNHAMNSDEIRNIALSGSYGSGKSSVIRSYESMKNDRKFLHISLARFTEEVNEKFKKADTAEEKDENITVIIDLGFIRVTKGNLNFIRSHYPNQVTLFLMQKKGVDIVILAEQNEIELNDEEVREMLESSDLQIDIAIRLMKAYGRPISIENIECSDAICAAIVENNFNEDDIPWIFVNYDELKSLTKQAFLKTVKRYGQEVYDVARREERIPEAVYATMIQELDTEDLRDLREYLPNPDFEAVCTTNQKPKFSGTEENRVILDYFKKQEWISSYQKLTDGRYQAFSTQKKLIEA